MSGHIHMGMRGTWKIALVIAGILGFEPGRRHRRKRRWYAHPLIAQDIKHIEMFHQIMQRLREYREHTNTTNSPH